MGSFTVNNNYLLLMKIFAANKIIYRTVIAEGDGRHQNLFSRTSNIRQGLARVGYYLARLNKFDIRHRCAQYLFYHP